MATAWAKTDNGHRGVKLRLRRHFLDRYHADGWARVLDCCAGDGVLWRDLRKDHSIARYTALDLKRRSGRLKIDSVKYLAALVDDDVIDIDTYGAPWKHWLALLPRVTGPTTVFLTVGAMNMSLKLDRQSLEALGIGSLPVPPSLMPQLRALATAELLGAAARHGLEIVEATEAIPRARSKTRYIGVRLVPSGYSDADAPPHHSPGREDPGDLASAGSRARREPRARRTPHAEGARIHGGRGRADEGPPAGQAVGIEAGSS